MEVETVVSVDLTEVAHLDYEGFLDLLCEEAGYPLLMDIDFAPVGVSEAGTIEVRVTGYLDEDDEDEY